MLTATPKTKNVTLHPIDDISPPVRNGSDLQLLLFCKNTPSPIQKEAGVVWIISPLYLPKDFYLCWVIAKQIQVDYSYQRIPNNPHLKKIEKSWNPHYFNLPILTCRNDGCLPGLKLYNEEGQHSVKAAISKMGTTIIKGHGECIQALVAFDKDLAFGASLCNSHNKSKKKQRPWESFRSGYRAKLKDHVFIVDTARKYNLSMPIEDAKMKNPDAPHQQQYLDILQNESQQRPFLDKLFKIQATCFKGQKHDVAFLKSLIAVLSTHKIKFSRNLVKCLNYTDIVDFICEKAQDKKAQAKDIKMSPEKYIRAVLEEIFRQGRVI